MGNGCTKDNTNVYFRARKVAAIDNSKLFSREGAAEMLDISVSTLTDYELGNTKVVPADKVEMMATLYNCPELKAAYCKNECPIGKTMAIAIEAKSIERTALRLIQAFDSEGIRSIEKSIIDIAADGEISESEKPKLEEIIRNLDNLSVVISEMKLLGEKALKRQC